jgi:hypothetical protein
MGRPADYSHAWTSVLVLRQILLRYSAATWRNLGRQKAVVIIGPPWASAQAFGHQVITFGSFHVSSFLAPSGRGARRMADWRPDMLEPLKSLTHNHTSAAMMTGALLPLWTTCQMLMLTLTAATQLSRVHCKP